MLTTMQTVQRIKEPQLKHKFGKDRQTQTHTHCADRALSPLTKRTPFLFSFYFYNQTNVPELQTSIHGAHHGRKSYFFPWSNRYEIMYKYVNLAPVLEVQDTNKSPSFHWVMPVKIFSSLSTRPPSLFHDRPSTSDSFTVTRGTALQPIQILHFGGTHFRHK